MRKSERLGKGGDAGENGGERVMVMTGARRGGKKKSSKDLQISAPQFGHRQPLVLAGLQFFAS